MMERFDVSEGDRFAEMVDAAERGRTVARMAAEPVSSIGEVEPVTFDAAAWEELYRRLPPELLGGDATAEVRAMRDEE